MSNTWVRHCSFHLEHCSSTMEQTWQDYEGGTCCNIISWTYYVSIEHIIAGAYKVCWVEVDRGFIDNTKMKGPGSSSECFTIGHARRHHITPESGWPEDPGHGTEER